MSKRGALTTFLCVGFGFSLIFSSVARASSSSTRKKQIHLALVADLLVDEAVLRKYQLAELTPESVANWRVVRVKTEDDIRRALQTNADEQIDLLMVYGLHTSIENGQPAATTRYWDGTLVYQSIDFYRAFTSSSFAAHAIVAFDSCKLVSTETAAATFNQLAAGLGLKSAYIYANTDYGVLHPLHLFASPWQRAEGAFGKFSRFALQAGWPVTIPFTYMLYFSQNQGVLARVHNGDVRELQNFRFHDMAQYVTAPADTAD